MKHFITKHFITKLFRSVLPLWGMGGCLLLFSACTDDFLSDRPEGSLVVAGTDYAKTENIFMPVSAAYAALRTNDAFGLGYLGCFEIAADDADKGSTPSDNPLMASLDNFTFANNHDHFNNLWNGYYSIVDAANFAIDEMPKYAAAQMSETNKDYAWQCQGEGKFLRAFAYFSLVRLFGNITIVERSDYTALERANLPQVTSAEVYRFIKKDLDEAIAVLPEEYGKGWDGRINKYTAIALKAKVHLYLAEYDSVALCAGQVIASGKYALLSNFRDVFRSKGECSEEMIFEIQYSQLGRTMGDAALPNDPYAFLQGPRSNTPANMQGWGLCVPSNSLVAFYRRRGEKIRAEVTLMKTDTVFEGSFITRAPDCPAYYNGKTFSPPEENTWSHNGYSREYNIRILRYADLLLMYAEAVVQGGAPYPGVMGAQEALDAVRTRAQLSSVPATLDNILDERHAELALEEDRFLDLVRQGNAQSVLSGKGFTAKNNLYPIPSNQMQLNPNLRQNNGYN